MVSAAVLQKGVGEESELIRNQLVVRGDLTTPSPSATRLESGSADRLHRSVRTREQARDLCMEVSGSNISVMCDLGKNVGERVWRPYLGIVIELGTD